MSADKRRARRFSIDQMLEISLGREHAVRCRGVDLSEVGVLCHTDVELEPGTRVFVMLQLGAGGDETTVSCEGVVARSGPQGKGYEAGISFSDLDASSRKRLSGFLSQQGE